MLQLQEDVRAVGGVDTFNFLVTGQVRSGASVLQTSIASHPKAHCHGDVLHSDDEVRRQCHEEYFGVDYLGEFPDWCAKGTWFGNAEAYLTTRVFDKPQRQEQAMGAKVLYEHICENDLWEYFRARCLEGDFCVLHVTRNPVACYISLKQAEQSGIWRRRVNERRVFDNPLPIRIDVEELTQFCRWHKARETRVEEMCDDALTVEYRELFLDYHTAMKEVFDFLELPEFSKPSPGVRRLKNRDMRQRAVNFETARKEAPRDVREHFEDPLLF